MRSDEIPEPHDPRRVPPSAIRKSGLSRTSRCCGRGRRTGAVAWQVDSAPSFGPTTVASSVTFNGPALDGDILQVRLAASGDLLDTVALRVRSGPVWPPWEMRSSRGSVLPTPPNRRVTPRSVPTGRHRSSHRFPALRQALVGAPFLETRVRGTGSGCIRPGLRGRDGALLGADPGLVLGAKRNIGAALAASRASIVIDAPRNFSDPERRSHILEVPCVNSV